MASKGDTVFYSNSAGTFRATVLVVHRDGSRTIQSKFMVDDAGKDVGAYLGFRYRIDAGDLRATA